MQQVMTNPVSMVGLTRPEGAVKGSAASPPTDAAAFRSLLEGALLAQVPQVPALPAAAPKTPSNLPPAVPLLSLAVPAAEGDLAPLMPVATEELTITGEMIPSELLAAMLAPQAALHGQPQLPAVQAALQEPPVPEMPLPVPPADAALEAFAAKAADAVRAEAPAAPGNGSQPAVSFADLIHLVTTAEQSSGDRSEPANAGRREQQAQPGNVSPEGTTTIAAANQVREPVAPVTTAATVTVATTESLATERDQRTEVAHTAPEPDQPAPEQGPGQADGDMQTAQASQRAAPRMTPLAKLPEQSRSPESSAPPAPVRPGAEAAAPRANEHPDPMVFQRSETAVPAGVEESVDAPPEPTRQVEPEAVIRQATRFMKLMLDGRRSEIKLQLFPEHLGELAVRLVVTEGTVRASLTAQDAAVKVALEQNLDQLRSRLTDHGLHVEQIQVAVGSNSQHMGHSHQSHRGQEQRYQGSGRQASDQGGGEPESGQTPQQPRNTRWSPGSMGGRINTLA